LNPPTTEAAGRSSAQKEAFLLKHPTKTGIFFYEQSVDALVEAIELFESREGEFSAHAIRAHVNPFDREYFKEQIGVVIAEALDTNPSVIASC
jgi:hypothetical protein